MGESEMRMETSYTDDNPVEGVCAVCYHVFSKKQLAHSAERLKGEPIMLNMDIKVYDTKEQPVKCTYIMREICGPFDSARTLKFVEEYSDQFTLEELIASCAVHGAIVFHNNFDKESELTYLRVEEAE